MKKYLSALLALALCLTMAWGGAPVLAEAPASPEAQTEATESPAEPTETATPTQAPPETQAPTQAPTPTEAPASTPEADEPTQEPSEAPTGEPSEGPSTEPTQGPSEGPSTEPTQGPGEEPSTEPTEGPSQAPTLEPTAGPTPPPEDEQAEAYVVGPLGKVSGKLEELLAVEGEKTIYIRSKQPLKIRDFQLKLLRDVTFRADPETFDRPGMEYIVRLTDGEGEEILPEAIEEAKDEDLVELNVAVEEKPEIAEPTPTPPGGDADIRLSVEPRNFAGDGVWQCDIPEFQLSGIPEGREGYCYVAIVYDERFIPLSGDCYLPTQEGQYALRFAIMNPQGDIVNGASEKYEPWLDYTQPALNISVSATQDYTMTLSGYDELSGVVALSLDGGETWTQAELDQGLSVVHTESKRKIFPAGMIRIRDLAGNESWNLEEIVLDKIPEMPSWGGFGGGGGGDGTPALPHASGDGDDAPYAAYELSLPEGAVDELTLGGEVIDLGLQIEEPDRAPDEPSLFTAELTAWARPASPAQVEDAEPAKDTLVIRAQTDGAQGPYTCRWRINGAVLRKLYNTDIQYLALSAGDAVLSLPTVGFTAGTRYAELKMRGVSTAEFEYEIAMSVDPGARNVPDADGWNLAPDCRAEISVEVEGERFVLVDRLTTPEMYPLDVYCGPSDLTEYPYGEYPRPEPAETEG